MQFNPNAPPVLGIEWLPHVPSYTTFSKTSTRLLNMPATVAQTIVGYRARVRDVPTSSTTFLALLEIFGAGNEAEQSTVQGWEALPNEDAAGSTIGASGWRRDPGASLVNLWSAIDDTHKWPQVGAPNADYIETTIGSTTRVQFHLNTAAFPLTARVLRLRIRAVVAALNEGGYIQRPFRFALTHDPGGAGVGQTVWSPHVETLYGGGYSTEHIVDCGEINPVTKLPWTPADIRLFDSNAANGWALAVNAVGSSNTPAAVISLGLFIEYVTTENRAAVAYWERPPLNPSGLIATSGLITVPGGAANFSKPASGQFSYGWRIANDRLLRPGGVPSSPGLTAIRTLGQGPPTKALPVIGGGTVGVEISALDSFGRIKTPPPFDDYLVPHLLQDVAGPTASVDSQPYYNEESWYAVLDGAAGNRGQRVIPGANATYIGVKFMVAPQGPATRNSTLRVWIRRVSDGVQMGGDFLITQAEALALPAHTNGYRLIEGFLASGAALVSGTTYEIRFELLAGGDPAGEWRLTNLNQGAEGSAVGFGGTTGAAAINGAVQANVDLAVQLLVQPAPVDTVEVRSYRSPTRQGIDCFCQVPWREVIALTWSRPAITGWAYTEIQRYEDTGSPDDDWQLAHIMRTENLSGQRRSYEDHGTGRGVPVAYRLRNFTTTGAFSDWVYSPFVTADAHGGELIFTSNHDPDLSLVYEHEPLTNFDFLDHSSDRFVRLEGRAMQVAFMDPTDRGVAIETELTANFGEQPCDDRGRPIGKQKVFEPLRRLARARLPYVIVLDAEGNRTLAHLTLSRGVNEEPFWQYTTMIRITPVGDIPLATEE